MLMTLSSILLSLKTQYGLRHNSTKSESSYFGTRQRLDIFNLRTDINIADSHIPVHDHLKILGVTIDKHFRFAPYAQFVVKSCNYHIQAYSSLLEIIVLLSLDKSSKLIVNSSLNIQHYSMLQVTVLICISLCSCNTVFLWCYHLFLCSQQTLVHVGGSRFRPIPSRHFVILILFIIDMCAVRAGPRL